MVARREEYEIRSFDLETARVSRVFRKDGPFLHFWLSVSPDEEWILYNEMPLSQSELMLVENFR